MLISNKSFVNGIAGRNDDIMLRKNTFVAENCILYEREHCVGIVIFHLFLPTFVPVL